MCFSGLIKLIPEHSVGKLVWNNGSLWYRFKRLSKIFFSHRIKYLRLRRRGRSKIKMLKLQKHPGKIKVKKRKFKRIIWFKIRIKTHWRFFKSPSKIYLKKLSKGHKRENGIFMMNKKDNGFCKMNSLYKKWLRWKTFCSIS